LVLTEFVFLLPYGRRVSGALFLFDAMIRLNGGFEHGHRHRAGAVWALLMINVAWLPGQNYRITPLLLFIAA